MNLTNGNGGHIEAQLGQQLVFPASSASVTGIPTFMEKLREDFIKEPKSRECPYNLRVWVVGNAIFQMHKDVFAWSSPVFKNMLRNNLSTSGNGSFAVKLQVEADVFRAIRQFLYTDDLPQNLCVKTALEVLEVSLQYDIDRLIPYIIKLIPTLMKTDDSFKVLQVSKVWDLTALENHALQIIAQNAEILLKTKEFSTLGCYDVIRILSRNDLCCTEELIFYAALNWAQNKAGSSKQALKYYFSQVEASVRFPLMTPAQLAKLPLNGDIMDTEDIIKLFQYVCLPTTSTKVSISSKYNIAARSENTCPPADICHSVSKEAHTATSSENDIITEIDAILHPSTTSSAKRRRIHSGGSESVWSGETAILNTTESLGTDRSSISHPSTTTNAKRQRTYSGGSESGVMSTDASVISTTKSHRLKQERRPHESDSDEDFFIAVKRIEGKESSTFEDLIRRTIKVDSGFTELHFNNVKVKNNYRTVVVKNCNDLKIDADCEFLKKKEAFSSFVSNFDPMRYIMINRSPNMKMSLESLWSSNLDMLLKFNGVTFLMAKHAENSSSEKDVLVLNYISESIRILRNDKLRPSTLAISNSDFSMKLFKERGKHIEKLILYQVWGDFTLEEIVKDCPDLTELVCWKYIPSWLKESNFTVPLSLNFSNIFPARFTIKRLVLYETELKFPIRCSILNTVVEELLLEGCYCTVTARINAHISDVFHQVFPTLKKLAIFDRERGNLATSGLLNCVIKKVAPIEWVKVKDMKWNNGKSEDIEEEISDAKLSTFFKANTNSTDRPENFVLEKVSGEGWIPTILDAKMKESKDVDGGFWTEEDKMEYKWYSLSHFFDSCESYEDYFICRNNNLRPILRI